MSATISSLFSSAEVKTIISQLESRLQAPISVEQAQTKMDQVQISAIGKIQGALTSLNGALSAIANPGSINPMVANVVGTAVTATAAASAPAGSYALTNIKLAKTQSLYSSIYASASAKVGSGSGAMTIKFSNGSSATIAIPSADNTVNGVVAAIDAANKGVTASIINTASGVELSLQSSTPGAQNAFSVSGTGSVSGLSYTSSGTGSTLTLAQAARNASLDLNGQAITETSNSNIQLLKGLTVGLTASGSATVAISQTGGGLSSALSTFATQLNSAISVVAKQTAYTAGKSSSSANGSGSSKAQAGPLLGDVQIQQLRQSLLSGISSAAGSGLSANALGFTISSGGQVSFDSSTFSTAYAANPSAVDKLVQSIAKTVGSVVSGAVGAAGATPAASGSSTPTVPATGFIQSASADLQATIKSLDQGIAQQQQIAAAQVGLLEQQFAAAEAATSGANSTLAYIGAVLGTSKP